MEDIYKVVWTSLLRLLRTFQLFNLIHTKQMSGQSYRFGCCIEQLDAKEAWDIYIRLKQR